MKRAISVIRDGLITQNPVFVLLLGMCPTMATSTTVKNAIGMGLAATVVLLFSNLFISLLRKIIPDKIRIASYVVVIAGFVTIVDLMLQAFFPDLSASLGVFIPLIVVNCIILARAEVFASKNNSLYSALDGLSMGLGFTFALVVLSTVRELLSSGTLLDIRILPENFPKVLYFALAPGGFLTLGCVIAFIQFITRKGRSKA